MTDIRYVCLSDMHLGEEDSLLTALDGNSSDIDARTPSPVMTRLVECLKELIIQNSGAEKPTLILNGDILEMALADVNDAAMVFERFIELIMPEAEGDRLFKEIIYIPGNHDHHLWEVARETMYVNYIVDTTQPKDKLNEPWHVSRLLKKEGEDLPITYFLTKLIQRYPGLKTTRISTAYPNYGLLNAERTRCVMFHHGHFIEPIYMLMSHLKTILFPEETLPTEVSEIEAENFAWIDFFWSAMGRSGKVGKDVEVLYEMGQSREGLKKLIRNFSKGIVRKFGSADWTPDFLEERIVSFALSMLADSLFKIEKKHTEGELSDSARDGLKKYLEDTLDKQLMHELKSSKPLETTFIFGHTHKPFAENSQYKNYSNNVNIYNSGGWVVESTATQSLHGGSIILFDEELNTTSLRMFNEKDDKKDYRVTVESAGGVPNLLYDRIKGLVVPGTGRWADFSTAAAEAVEIRKRNLNERTT